MKYDKNEPVYWRQDLSDNFYFIYKGQFKLTAENGNGIAKYSQGEILGDSDALLSLPRDCKATASIPSTLYMVKMEDCADLFVQFPHMKSQMMRDAELKRIKHAKKIAEIEKKSPIFMENLKTVITHNRIKQIQMSERTLKRQNTAEIVANEIEQALESYNQKEFDNFDLAQLYDYLD